MLVIAGRMRIAGGIATVQARSQVTKEIPSWAGYRPADVGGVSCGTCDWIKNGLCTMFENTPVELGYVCDSWEGSVDKDDPSIAPLYTAPPPNAPPDTPEGLRDLLGALEPDPVSWLRKAGVSAAGIAVRAADTGRVLMLQRKDSGEWEFPGGKLNDGEHPYIAARREWQEETGRRLPRGNHLSSWNHGNYQGFVHEVPSEFEVGPRGEDKEQLAWWDPNHMKRSRAVRQELHSSRAWNKVSKAGGELYLISHAKTRYNKPGQPHDMVHGWKNTPLDDTGRQQARKLGKLLADCDIDALYSSDLARAAQTSGIISKVIGVADKTDKVYRPWNLGNFAGHSSADVIPKLKPFMEHPERPVDGGESFNDFTERFLPALERLLTQVKNGKTVALVTHSRNVELVEGWIKGRGPRKQIDTSAIEHDKLDPAVVFRITPNGKRWKIEQIADETVKKGQAHPATLHLRVNGVLSHPAGRVYRMVSRDGHYVGRTNPTKVKARKGDVLKIQAADFMQEVDGDFRWSNPNVAAAYTDSPHSWRELQALAGGSIDKNFAPGPGGDAPPAGDSPMGASNMPSAGTLAAMEPAAQSPIGPTLNQVHVNRPLKNISVGYMNKKIKLQVMKAEPEKQLVYGIVLEPHFLDSQDDFMMPNQVEKAAHNYMKKVARGKASVSKIQHRTQAFFKNKQGVVPVESFIAPVDFTYDGVEQIKKGSWVMCVHCEDPEIWEGVKRGDFTGFSIGGTGIRQSVSGSVPDVPSGWMTRQPSSWFNSNGGVAKARPEDFERWRDHEWEGS